MTTPSIQLFVERLKGLVGKERISISQEYFPYVFAVRNPSIYSKGYAIGVLHSTLAPIEKVCNTNASREWSIDTEIFDCREMEKINAYFYDWDKGERDDAESWIADYRLRHEFKDNRRIEEFFAKRV